MVTNQKVFGKAASMPAGIGVGLASSLLIMIVSCGILGVLMDKEIMQLQNLGYGIMVVLLVSSLAGAWISCALIKRRRLLVSMLLGVCLMAVLLLINGLLFGGNIAGGWVTGLLIFGGSGAAALLGVGGMGRSFPKGRKWATG